MLEQVWKLTRRIYGFAGKKLIWNLTSMIALSFIEGIGIFMLVPLISLTGLIHMGSADAFKLQWLTESAKHVPLHYRLLLILIIYVLLMVGQSFFQQNQQVLNMRIQQGFIRHLRENVNNDILQSGWSLFLIKRKSDMTNLLSTEVNRVGGGVVLLLQLTAQFVFTMIQIGVAFWLSGKMTICIIIFGLLLIACSRTLVRRSSRLGEESFQLNQTFLGTVTDQLSGMKEIKSNSLEGLYSSLFRSLCAKMEQNIMRMIKINAISNLIYKTVSSLLITGFIYIFFKMFLSHPAQLILILAIFSRLWPKFTGIQSMLEQLSSILPSFKALNALQRECETAHEMDIAPETAAASSIAPLTLVSGLECRNLSYRYPLESIHYALRDINLFIPTHGMTAIVGRSGAGKSTLVDILMGLMEPVDGQVLLDGQPLTKERVLSLRQSLSYVPQDPFLFNTSIRDNLRMVAPDADEADLWEALEFAAASHFVRRLPQGLDTVIGDRGIRLSGGERQRLVLARAILRKPSILVLDEATSSLDSENEANIQEALERIKRRMTVIVIAHRLSTIRSADQVIVLEEGSVIQNGEYRKLAQEKSGLFRTLLGKQMDIEVIQ